MTREPTLSWAMNIQAGLSKHALQPIHAAMTVDGHIDLIPGAFLHMEIEIEHIPEREMVVMRT